MQISNSNVLITGGAGLVGSHLADALLARGCRVKLLDSLEPYTHPHGAPEWIPQEAKFISGNLRDKHTLEEALRDVDFVFHQAAFTGFDPESTRYLDANTLGTAEIFDVIAEQHFPIRKIVVASSLSIYGEGKYQCQSHGVSYPDMRPLAQLKRHQWQPKCNVCGEALNWLPTDEASPTLPFTPYAVSKYAAELLALALGKRLEIPTVALRYAVAYGSRQSIFNAYSTVITTFATLLANDRPPVLYEDGQQCRDWTYVEDIVRANLFAMEDERTNYQSFNVGTGVPGSVRLVAELLAKSLGRSIAPVTHEQFRPGDIRNLVLDVSKLRALGFEPRVTLEEGISRFVTWFQSLGKVQQYYSALEERMRTSGELLS